MKKYRKLKVGEKVRKGDEYKSWTTGRYKKARSIGYIVEQNDDMGYRRPIIRRKKKENNNE